MTARQGYEAVLIELSKEGAPSMPLADFNYFFNKAINQRINKFYNIYDITQQTSDDLRVLKATAILTPKELSTSYGASYEVNLPLDYVHLLNCICEYRVDEKYKCYSPGDSIQFAAKRLTADSWSVILNDYYNRPTPERPYYYINNLNTSNEIPTNPIINNKILASDTVGTDSILNYSKESGLPRTISLKDIKNTSLIEKEAGVRYGNASQVRLEIRCGQNNKLKLANLIVDYIKAPQLIKLTQEQINLVEDTSQVLEFPDYVCYQIIDELVLLILENNSDPRLQTHLAVTTSTASSNSAV